MGVVCPYLDFYLESSQSTAWLLVTGEREIAIGCESVSQSASQSVAHFIHC